jgi:hypothetical protein
MSRGVAGGWGGGSCLPGRFARRRAPSSPPPPPRAAPPQVHTGAARVTLCCALSELAHAQQAGTDLGVEAYREYEEALRQDLAQVGGGEAEEGRVAFVRPPGASPRQAWKRPRSRLKVGNR